MNCIIVDDEPLAREAMKLLIEESDNLQLIGSFNSAATASDFMEIVRANSIPVIPGI